MSDEESGGELLEQLKKFDVHVPEKESFKERFIKSWKNLKLKSAIGHVGLLISLCIYCGVGGLVSIYFCFFLKKFVTELKFRRIKFIVLLLKLIRSTILLFLASSHLMLLLWLQKYEEYF